MNEGGEQKAGKLEVLRGGKGWKSQFRGRRRGPRTRTQAEMELDRRMQTAFALVTDPAGRVPDKRTYRIREGDAFPWRVLGRAFVALRHHRVQRDQVKAIVRTLDAWTDDLYDGTLTFPRAA